MSSEPKASPASPLTHFDAQGQAHMVDVGAKASTPRVAVAEGQIRMLRSTFEPVSYTHLTLPTNREV